MNATEFVTVLFTLCNAARVLAYVPQIPRIAKDRDDPHAVSCAAWGLFFIAILATATYALVVVRDLTMAAIFAGNMLACLAIVNLTLAPMPQWELSLEALSMKSIGHVLSSLGRQGRGLLRLAVAGC